MTRPGERWVTALRAGVSRVREVRRHGLSATAQWDRLETEGIVSAGPGTYGTEHVHVHEFRSVDDRWLGARLRIGSYTSIAPCEVFLSGNHRTDWVSQFPFRSRDRLVGPEVDAENATNGDVEIGSDVWIGTGAVIMSGVRVGHGAVVGARAVVARDVEPYTVVVGNPARPVRRRFDEATVTALLDMAWWDWPEERIRAELPRLTAPPDAVGDNP